MRGKAERQGTMLSIITPELLVPKNHPIRHIKPIVDRVLEELSPTFARMYAEIGRPSIPPEHLLKGCLLIALFSVRSERQFCERLQYDLLFKWFLDLNVIDPAFDATAFSHNKERLLQHEVALGFPRRCMPSTGRQPDRGPSPRPSAIRAPGSGTPASRRPRAGSMSC